ncbi:Protein ABHD18 (Alpha/beta hydrolase domain-containing protein 18) (Abhydrolase domain-containing protein 18) [Durusdinium trenchii]|uniref:Protein ABHD18 (Alpha/beta hydrolase domain-containing protein 18) (Abhydrolase domain-containing protein 18) n=1 Tax=Durusdinium trenchii TaxID=1381693 RepID=A0ABP0J9X8_9DINO
MAAALALAGGVAAAMSPQSFESADPESAVDNRRIGQALGRPFDAFSFPQHAEFRVHFLTRPSRSSRLRGQQTRRSTPVTAPVEAPKARLLQLASSACLTAPGSHGTRGGTMFTPEAPEALRSCHWQRPDRDDLVSAAGRATVRPPRHKGLGRRAAANPKAAKEKWKTRRGGGGHDRTEDELVRGDDYTFGGRRRTVLGWAKSLLDLVFVKTGRSTAEGEQFFWKGTGDMEAYRRKLEEVREHDFSADADSFDIEFGEEKNGCSVGTFESPVADLLPEESKTGRVMLVMPEGPVKGCAILMAATGDHGFGSRKKKVAEPLQKHGIATLILQIAFYGKRRPAHQRNYYISTVAEFLSQATACYTEATMLTSFARKRFPDAKVLLAGTSFGGAMASAGATYAAESFEGDLGICTLVAPSRPLSFLTGRLSNQVNLQAILDEDDSLKTEKDAQDKLVQLVQHEGIVESGALEHKYKGTMYYYGMYASSDYIVTRANPAN